MKLNVKKFGMSLGLTFALVYLGCALVIIIAGHEASISFFNTLMHGIDVSPIVRMDMPLWEALLGIIEIFILGWLIGACIAGFYNANLKEEK